MSWIFKTRLVLNNTLGRFEIAVFRHLHFEQRFNKKLPLFLSLANYAGCHFIDGKSWSCYVI